MRFKRQAPADTAQGGMIGHGFSGRKAEEFPQRQGVAAAPADAALRVDALEVADQKHAEMTTRRDGSAANVVGAKRGAQGFKKAVKATLTQNFLQLFVKNMTLALWYLIIRQPHTALLFLALAKLIASSLWKMPLWHTCKLFQRAARRERSKMRGLFQKITGLLFVCFYPFTLFITNASAIVVPDGYYIACTEEFVKIFPYKYPSYFNEWRHTSVSNHVPDIGNTYKMSVLMHDGGSWTWINNNFNIENMTSYRRTKFVRVKDGFVLIAIVRGSQFTPIEQGIAQDTLNHVYNDDYDWAKRCSVIDIREPLPDKNFGGAEDSCM